VWESAPIEWGRKREGINVILHQAGPRTRTNGGPTQVLPRKKKERLPWLMAI